METYDAGTGLRKGEATALEPAPYRDRPAVDPRQGDANGIAPQMPARLCNLPPLSAIVNQLIALTADPDVELHRLAAVMEKDPAFVADVLFLANCALFGFRPKIRAVRHAVSLLGVERIKALAITAAVRKFSLKGGPLLAQCWHHSVACAIISEELAPLFSVNADTAYTVGLMHDIGRLGLLKSYTADYLPILDHAFENGDEVIALERTLIKVDHSHAGAWMVRTWGFPPVFEEACQCHHEPLHPRDSALLQTVKVSCRLAAAIGYAAVRYKEPDYGKLVASLPSNIPSSQFPAEALLRATVAERLAGLSQVLPRA